MDRGAWWTSVRGVAKELDTHTKKRIGHDLVTQQQEGFFTSGLMEQQQNLLGQIYLHKLMIFSSSLVKSNWYSLAEYRYTVTGIQPI